MFLLDTNVLSEFRLLLDGRAHPSVAAWAARQDPDTFYISAMTLFETEIGIQRMERRDPAQGQILRIWMTRGVIPRFAGRTLVVDDRVAALAASFHVPSPAALADSLIAATAAIHRLTVVTRNVADFGFPGVSVLNPWNVER